MQTDAAPLITGTGLAFTVIKREAEAIPKPQPEFQPCTLRFPLTAVAPKVILMLLVVVVWLLPSGRNHLYCVVPVSTGTV